MDSKTPVVQTIGRMAVAYPDAMAMTWLNDQIKPEVSLTYKDLWEAAGAIADKLTSKKVGLKPLQTVILCFPFGIEFMVAMIGCMRAGVVAVSVYPPDPKHLDRDIPKLVLLVADADTQVALTTRSYKRIVQASKFAGKKWPQIKSWVSVNMQLGKSYRRVREDYDVQPDDLCFIQYTSGSTGTPKGVMVSHRNIAHNAAYCAEGSQAGYIMLSWLPKYHDYALIHEIAMLITGGHFISMSPISFIRQPLCWLTAMETYKPQYTIGPTFSYKLTIKRLQKALEEGKLVQCPDLSSLRSIGIAAEPFDEETLKDIVENLKIPPSKIKAAYGMAELCVKGCVETGIYIDPETRLPSSGDLANAKKWDMTFVVADRATLTPLPDGITGTIYISGPSVVSGYYNLEDVNHERFGLRLEGIESATFLDTMDLGFIRDGRLFINGRIKDVIIINGSNKYPQDIEKKVEEHPILGPIIRPGCSAAFQMELDSFGYIGELRPGAVVNEIAIAEVRRLLDKEFGRCDAFGLYPKGTIPKTTSGKVRRSEAASLFKSNKLNNNSITDTGRPVSSMCELLMKYGVEDSTLTLAESGVDSLRLTRLIDEASSVLNITIDPGSITSVPAGLLGSLSSACSPEMPSMPTSADYMGTKMKGSELFQVLGIALVILTFAASSIPAWSFWCLLKDVIAPQYPMMLTTFNGGPGFLIPGVFIVWMISFSIAVVLMKWVIIGKYEEGSHAHWSPYFCRWWLMDRFINVWETYVGGLILSTPWGNMFYMLLGANIHPSARLGSFVREQDLFTAGERTQISGMVHCRLVDAHGLILKKTTVLRGSAIKVSDATYPGTVHNTDALSHSGRYIQRLISPLFVIAAYSGAIVFASYITSFGALFDNYAFARLPVCAIIAQFAVLAFAAILQRCNVIIEYFYESPIDVLIDTLAGTAENYLSPWIVRSVFIAIIAKLFGANVSITTEMSRFSSIISPSKARFFSAGPHTNLSVCIVTPTRLQPIRVGKGAAIGRSAHLKPGCYVQDGASVNTNAIVPENTTISGAYFREGMELPRREKTLKGTSDWKSKLRLFLTDAGAIVLPVLVRAAFSWAPLISILGILTFSLPIVDAFIPSAAPMWLHTPVLFLYFICCASLASELIGSVYGLCIPADGTIIHLKNPRTWLYAIHISFAGDWFGYILPFIAGSWIYNFRLSILGVKFSGGIFSSILLGGVADYPLIRIGKGAVLERASLLAAHHMEYFRIEFAKAEIGNKCSIHPQSYLLGGDRIGDNVTIAMKTQCKFVPGGIVRANKTGVFVGIPAIEVDLTQDELKKDGGLNTFSSTPHTLSTSSLSSDGTSSSASGSTLSMNAPESAHLQAEGLGSRRKTWKYSSNATLTVSSQTKTKMFNRAVSRKGTAFQQAVVEGEFCPSRNPVTSFLL